MDENKKKDSGAAEETVEAVNDSAETVATDSKAAKSKKTGNKDGNKDGKKDDKKSEKKLKAEIELLRSELETQREVAEEAAKAADDKYLRLMAEYDNFRRRSKEEKDAVYVSAVSDTLAELLPLFDNLDLASKYTGENSTEAGKGVEMILASVPAILEKLGVTVFGEVGEPFDPTIHNAVMHIEDESLGESVIADVFQKGYRHGDRIIRFAMVRVAN